MIYKTQNKPRTGNPEITIFVPFTVYNKNPLSFAQHYKKRLSFHSTIFSQSLALKFSLNTKGLSSP